MLIPPACSTNYVATFLDTLCCCLPHVPMPLLGIASTRQYNKTDINKEWLVYYIIWLGACSPSFYQGDRARNFCNQEWRHWKQCWHPNHMTCHSRQMELCCSSSREQAPEFVSHSSASSSVPVADQCEFAPSKCPANASRASWFRWTQRVMSSWAMGLSERQQTRRMEIFPLMPAQMRKTQVACAPVPVLCDFHVHEPVARLHITTWLPQKHCGIALSL